MSLSTKFFFFLCSSFLLSCVGTPPLKEYSLARSALKYAKAHGAKRHASGAYTQAISLYREAQSHFKSRYYGSAREAFTESRELSEEAEEVSRWKKYEKGDFSL